MHAGDTEGMIFMECVSGCEGHSLVADHWTQVTVAGAGGLAVADVYQVALAGKGGVAKAAGTHAHGVIAVASGSGRACSGDGGVAVSGGGGQARVEKWGYAYANGGKAMADACSVAGTSGGHASAADRGIAVGWFSSHRTARVEAGAGGVAISGAGCYVRAGKGGVLIAMSASTNPGEARDTRICRVGECGIIANQWYLIEPEGKTSFKFSAVDALPVWEEEVPGDPCRE